MSLTKLHFSKCGDLLDFLGLWNIFFRTTFFGFLKDNSGFATEHVCLMGVVTNVQWGESDVKRLSASRKGCSNDWMLCLLCNCSLSVTFEGASRLIEERGGVPGQHSPVPCSQVVLNSSYLWNNCFTQVEIISEKETKLSRRLHSCSKRHESGGVQGEPSFTCCLQISRKWISSLWNCLALPPTDRCGSPSVGSRMLKSAWLMSAVWTAARFIYCCLLWGALASVCFCQPATVGTCACRCLRIGVGEVRQPIDLRICVCIDLYKLEGDVWVCVCGRHTFLPFATVCWLSRDFWIGLRFSCSSSVSISLLWILIGCQKAFNTLLSDCKQTQRKCEAAFRGRILKYRLLLFSIFEGQHFVSVLYWSLQLSTIFFYISFGCERTVFYSRSRHDVTFTQLPHRQGWGGFRKFQHQRMFLHCGESSTAAAAEAKEPEELLRFFFFSFFEHLSIYLAAGGNGTHKWHTSFLWISCGILNFPRLAVFRKKLNWQM